MRPANYAPVYCALYPDLAEIARKHGWALSIHGSLARDFDLICIPWIEVPSPPEAVIQEITDKFTIEVINRPDIVFHGRRRWTVTIAHGECAIDLQFVPTVTTNALSGPLADALLKLYEQVKETNSDGSFDHEPFFVQEMEAIERLIEPDLIDRLIQSPPVLKQKVDDTAE